ncbi:hypothetical protein [Chlamydia trachomatis]|uniref:hypothetical protein n=1 Tax=Chlamydia trachomatis TaxID=813 RepID=UPI001E3ECA1F|nr:hypothetical protein [Chlamydia trachomatis]
MSIHGSSGHSHLHPKSSSYSHPHRRAHSPRHSLQNHLLQLGPFQELIDLHSLPTIVSSLGTLH